MNRDEIKLNIGGAPVTLKRKQTDNGTDYWTTESVKQSGETYNVTIEDNDIVLRSDKSIPAIDYYESNYKDVKRKNR